MSYEANLPSFYPICLNAGFLFCFLYYLFYCFFCFFSY